MPSPNALLTADWLKREAERDRNLALLLGPKLAELFDPEPKRVSLEHWELIVTKKEKQK